MIDLFNNDDHLPKDDDFKAMMERERKFAKQAKKYWKKSFFGRMYTIREFAVLSLLFPFGVFLYDVNVFVAELGVNLRLTIWDFQFHNVEGLLEFVNLLQAYKMVVRELPQFLWQPAAILLEVPAFVVACIPCGLLYLLGMITGGHRKQKRITG